MPKAIVATITRQAVHDTGLAGMLLPDETQELRARVILVDDRVADIRAVEARNENPGVFERKARGDLGAGLRIGRRGEGDSRHARKPLVQEGKLQVFRPEIVAPLRNAVRFVDGEKRDFCLREELEAARCREALGRDVQDVELTP